MNKAESKTIETDNDDVGPDLAAADNELRPERNDVSTQVEPPVALQANSLLRQIDWQIVGIVLGIHAVVMIYGAAAYQLLFNERVKGWHGLLAMWNRWDALRHVRIAEVGYTNVGDARADLVGFPLYPWLVRLFSYVFQDTQLSAFIVSGLATIAAALLLHRLTRLDEPDTVARNSVWFLLIFPTSYFLHINYNESLFIAVTLGCFLAARQKNWMVAGIIGIFVCMTRLNGLVIIPALMVEALQQYRETRRVNRQWAYIALIPLGFIVYLLINRHVTGDLFAFLTIGREMFFKALAPPWIGINSLYTGMWAEPPSGAVMTGVQEFFFTVLSFICIFFCAWLLRPAYTVWIAGNWLLFTSVGFILSVPRYTLTLFPIFILFAKLAQRPVWYSVITVWSLMFLAMFIGQFVRGPWAF
ncbi:MAG: glycosyltransferase family 39 protein [Pyrinomonadaceae bacterium]